MHPQHTGGNAAKPTDTRTVFDLKFLKKPDGANGLFSGLGNCVGKKVQPMLPVPIGANLVEQFIIARTMFFLVEAQIQQRFAQDFLVAQDQGNQQPAQPSVAVQKGMNGLKLDVRHCRLQQSGHWGGPVMEEQFQITHARHNMFRRRRNKHRVTWTGTADPILAAPEFTGCGIFSPPAGHEFGVHFLNQPQLKWKSTSHPLQPMLHSRHVITDFARVIHRHAGGS